MDGQREGYGPHCRDIIIGESYSFLVIVTFPALHVACLLLSLGQGVFAGFWTKGCDANEMVPRGVPILVY